MFEFSSTSKSKFCLLLMYELITDLYVLDNTIECYLYGYTKIFKGNHTFPERVTVLKDI